MCTVPTTPSRPCTYAHDADTGAVLWPRADPELPVPNPCSDAGHVHPVILSGGNRPSYSLGRRNFPGWPHV